MILSLYIVYRQLNDLNSDWVLFVVWHSGC